MNCFLLKRVCLFLAILLNFSLQGKAQTAYEKKLIQSIRLERNAKKQYLRMLSLGEYYKTINIHRADSMSHVLLAKSRQFEDSIRFSALMFSAEVNRLAGNQEEYFTDILACQPFLNKLKSDRVIYTLYHHLGYYHSISHEFGTAKFYLETASSIALKKRINADIADNYNFMALHYMLQNNKDSALYFSDMALKYGRRSSGKKMLDECLNTQSTIYYHFGQIELSVAKNILAADWAEKTGDLYHLAQYYREIGMSQRLIRNLDDAEFYLTQSFNYSKQIADYRQMGLSLVSIGYIRYERKEYEAAITKVNQAMRILNKRGDANGLGEAYNLLGMVNREKKDYAQAAISLNKALVFFESTGNQEKIAEIYHNVGTVFIKQEKYQNALHYLERSVEIRKKSGNQNQIYESYRVMSEVYQDLDQASKALIYLEKYVNYMDSNSLVMATKKIADLSENYRSEQRFRLIQTQADSIEQQRKNKILTETKLENSQLRNNFQLYIIIALLVVSILAGIIYFYRTNQVKIKQQQREAEMSQTLLRAQMNPHFVFNAMSVIQSYIYENDTVNSSKFLVNFSRLMRLILENSPKEFIPLETEVEILQKYLETQKLRFGDRFDYTIDISDDILTEHAVIPPMITQPFIENAIEHGQLHTIEDGHIDIRFKRTGKLLEVTIEDNGIGRAGAEQNKKSKAHKSMAMDITRERIQNLNNKYGTEGFLDVQDLNTDRKTGTKVLISLPYKEDNLAPSTP
jgi:tetratricopeptide (TPR) repeat protein